MIRNHVMAGAYMGSRIQYAIKELDGESGLLIIIKPGFLFFSKAETVLVCPATVDKWELMNTVEGSSKATGIEWGFGISTASISRDMGYLMAVQFKDGKRSLLELDESFYTWFLQIFFK